jgi:ferredoxin-NADP reductase/predicted pyridoxine 5'-phosphate oxidase superfamily flavin-nucleotide-binding protein
MSDNKKSQFHSAEIAIQEKLGIADMVAKYSEGFVRPAMPEQHRDFFNKLISIIMGAVDRDGYPWTLPLFGDPGFIQSPDEKTLSIQKLPDLVKILDLDFTVNKKIGLLGIELHTRRRNRMNGIISSIDDEQFSVSVEQSFGNCPQYIQKRQLDWSENRKAISEYNSLTLSSDLSEAAKTLISNADTFFIASRTKQFTNDERCGIDASHRGGKPGFVKVEGSTLYFPDFSGNRFFNTLGNIKSDGRVGIYVPDFSTGNAVFLCGDAEIIWDEEIEHKFAGAERVISVNIRKSIYLENYLEKVGELVEMSPSLDSTGTWSTADEKTDRQLQYQIIDKQKESEQISSFYLAPVDKTKNINQYTPGQFLPISVFDKTNNIMLRRTYTLSRAHKKDAYRISVKREEHGLVSRILHDELKIGDVIDAGVPNGQFTIAKNNHTVVLLSGGVGITPMFAMLEGLVIDNENQEDKKNVWFIHSTANAESMAFANELSSMSKRYSWLNVHIAYSRKRPIERDFPENVSVSKGRVNVALLKELLPFDQYDFYLCGSEGFMRSIYSDLINTGVSKSNIYYEFFGQGSITDDKANKQDVTEKTTVHLTKSDMTLEWTPSDGTLLELAEQNGVKAMFSCRVGNCGSCACKLSAGEVAYSSPPSYTPNKDEILLCSARPSANTTVLKIDL